MQAQRPTDGGAFADFVRAQTGPLLRTAHLLTGSAAGAEELVQDTLVRLFPKWQRVQGADSSLAYVRRAMVNGFLNNRRRPSSRREFAVETLPEAWDGIDLAAGVADRDLVWRLLATLPDRQRAALVMRFFHDLDDAEIATCLDCRLGTVRSLTSRALATLRERAASQQPATWSRPRRSA
jgi:RNA polymerase sigma-70 factor (sigma-E family)